MSTILGLKFRDYGQIYHFDSGAFVVSPGDKVIVKTDQGMGLGEVIQVREYEEGEDPAEFKPIYRLATDEDELQLQENEALAKEAFRFCRERIKDRKLDMKLVDVEMFFDKGKIIFYFTAPSRIDFRELVKDLVKNYRTRIELRQIGVRHETQMIGAVGNCGLVCCCRGFLRKFAPVTIKMAKEQNLFLNPSKISGMCGRLLCCLSYEQENYENFHRKCPKLGKKYSTENGIVKVLRSNIFSHSLTVLTENNEEQDLTLEDWEELNPTRPDPEELQAMQQKQQQKQQERAQRPSRPRPKPKQKSKGPATYDVDDLKEFTVDEKEDTSFEQSQEPDDPPKSDQTGKETDDKQGRPPKKSRRSRSKRSRSRGPKQDNADAGQAKQAQDSKGDADGSDKGQPPKKSRPRRRRRKSKSKSKQQSENS